MWKPKWVERISNKQYDIWDCYVFGRTLSITVLKPGEKTNGHEHPYRELYTPVSDSDSDETYILKVGDIIYDIPLNYKGFSIYVIPPNTFHQIINNTNHLVTMICQFEGKK